MPTVRTPIARATRTRVTPEAKAVFARAVALRPTYDACLSGKCCATLPNSRCAACSEYIALSQELSRLLARVLPWEPSPLETESEDPPERNPLRAEAWRKAYALRLELQEP